MSNQPQFHYVLTGDRSRRAACQLGVSLCALRKVEGNASVTLSCDNEANQFLENSFSEILDLVDVTLRPTTRHSAPVKRSRELKILALQYLDGDFIYLDNDTLPIQPFYSKIEAVVDDVGLVQDHNHEYPLNTGVPSQVANRYALLGWNVQQTNYFNAGIGFYREGKMRHQLSQRWFDLWQESVVKTQAFHDQHCLNAAVEQLAISVSELPSKFNAMVTVHPRHARDAHIYHYFAGNRDTIDGSLFEHLISYYEQHRTVDWPTLEQAVSLEHPWMPPYWPKRFWQAGRPHLAIKYWLANRLKPSA